MSKPAKLTPKTVADKAVDDAALRRRKARSGPPTEADAPPFKPFPGRKPYIHDGQQSLA